MTREEQIWQAAVSNCMGSSHTAERKRYKFIEGARWADQNPQWRSVEDELPPIGSQSLVCNVDEVEEFGYWWAIRYEEPTDRLVDRNGFVTLSGVEVTHWMRIEPPKKGDNQ